MGHPHTLKPRLFSVTPGSRAHVLGFLETNPKICVTPAKYSGKPRNTLSASQCSCFLDKGSASIVSLSHRRSFTNQPLFIHGPLRFSENKVRWCADDSGLPVDPLRMRNQALTAELVLFLDHVGLEHGCNIGALLHWTRLKTT
jgi:hypothetical protein